MMPILKVLILSSDYCTLHSVQSPYFMNNIFLEKKSGFANFVLFGTFYDL
jgi:hypothetical protein